MVGVPKFSHHVLGSNYIMSTNPEIHRKVLRKARQNHSLLFKYGESSEPRLGIFEFSIHHVGM